MSWRSQPKARSVVRARRGRRDLHVYHWSPLTSGSRSFALWPLLLPFTLVNVAGWMAPPGPRTWRTTLHRLGAVWVGLTTTATTVVWLLLAATTVWHTVTGQDERAPGNLTEGGFVMASIAAAVAMAALVLMATFNAAGFERYRPDHWPTERRRWKWPWGAGLAARLDDPRFHDNGDDHHVRWLIHVVVALATWLAVVVVVFVDGTEQAGHLIGRALVVVGVLQGIGVFALAVAGLAGGADDYRRLTRRLLPAAAAVLGILLLGGLVLSALIAVTAMSELPAGPPALLYDCYGWAFLGAIGAAAGCTLYAMLTRVSAEKGAARSLLPTIDARIRARLATVLSTLDWIVTSLALGFVVSAGLALYHRRNEIDTWQLAGSAPVNVARSTFAFVLAFTVLNLVKSRASPAALRRIGNVWDILTFWPRSYHPFAVRPYAERAVPELQEFLRAAPRTGTLVVSAHSQGSVIAYAAVRPFVTPEGGCSLPAFALVTFGCPLQSLYAAVFPHYFTRDEFMLTSQAIPGGWVNCFRFTDHVGRAIFRSDADVATSYAQGAVGADRPIDDARPPAGTVRGHNDYWDEPVIRAAVEQGGATIRRTA